MNDIVSPSYDPANNGNMPGMLREVLKKSLQVTDDMLPCQVLAYDRTANRARVQVLVQLLDTSGVLHSRAEIASVPVLLLGGGDFFIGFDLPAGSLGWLKASDRDISLFLQNYQESGPGSLRLHSFEDALFIPDAMTDYTIAAEDAQAMVIQNSAGDVRVALDATGIRVTSPQVEVFTGATTVTVTTGQVTIDGADLQVNGDIDATGTITGDTDVVTGAISLNSHTHPQDMDSGGNTEQDVGAPQ